MELRACMGLVTAVALAVPLASAEAAAPPAGSRDIPTLIGELGADSFFERQHASDTLRGRPDALPLLRRASRSSDLEQRQRAEQLLQDLGPRGLARQIARVETFVRSGAIDVALETVLQQAHWDPKGEALWPLRRLAGQALLREKGEYGRLRMYLRDGLPVEYDIDLEIARGAIRRERCAGAFVDDGMGIVYLRGGGYRGASLARSILATAGAVRVTKRLTCGLIFANGDVEIENASHSVIVCDGDVTVRGASQSLVLARGKVQFGPGTVGFSVFLAGGPVPDVPSMRWATRTAEGTVVVMRKRADVAAVGGQTRMLGLVRFFETSDVGVEVVASRPAVRVSKLSPGSPLAKVGVRAGDLVNHLDGKPTSDVEAFRRLLRSRVAEGGFGEVRVSRAGRTLVLKPYFPE